MRFNKSNKNINKRILGATMVEYILGLSIMVIAISVVKIPGTNKSAIQLLEQSLKEESSAYSKSIANPR